MGFVNNVFYQSLMTEVFSLPLMMSLYVSQILILGVFLRAIEAS